MFMLRPIAFLTTLCLLCWQMPRASAQGYDDVYLFLGDTKASTEQGQPEAAPPAENLVEPSEEEYNYPSAVSSPRFENPDYVGSSDEYTGYSERYVPSPQNSVLTQDYQQGFQDGFAQGQFNQPANGFYRPNASLMGPGFGGLSFHVGNRFANPWYARPSYCWYYSPYNGFYDPWMDPFYSPWNGSMYDPYFGNWAAGFYHPWSVSRWGAPIYHTPRRVVRRDQVASYPRSIGTGLIDQAQSSRQGTPRNRNTNQVTRGSRGNAMPKAEPGSSLIPGTTALPERAQRGSNALGTQSAAPTPSSTQTLNNGSSTTTPRATGASSTQSNEPPRNYVPSEPQKKSFQQSRSSANQTSRSTTTTQSEKPRNNYQPSRSSSQSSRSYTPSNSSSRSNRSYSPSRSSSSRSSSGSSRSSSSRGSSRSGRR